MSARTTARIALSVMDAELAAHRRSISTLRAQIERRNGVGTKDDEHAMNLGKRDYTTLHIARRKLLDAYARAGIDPYAPAAMAAGSDAGENA